jgi:tetratricopeptide (TPR) repeat protein
LRAEIVAALDDWASITEDAARRAWLLAVARAADPDPSRDRLRQQELWQDAPKLAQVAQELRVAELSPQLATALGRVLFESRGDALPLLTAAQARLPQDFWLNLELGITLYYTRRWDEAIGYFRAALALRPEVSVVYNDLGAALYAKGQTDEALGCLQQAVRLDPQSALAHINLAEILKHNGRWDEAFEHYEQTVLLDPTSACAHHNLGYILRTKGQLDKAIEHYQQAVILDPKVSGAHHDLGAALQAKGRLDEAVDQYQQALRIDPKFPTTHCNLGVILQGKGQWDEAISHYEEAIRLDPNIEGVYHALDACLYPAACAAVRAAVGEGTDKSPLSAPERAGLRRKALQRLRASLELKGKRLKDSKLTASSLVTWQADPALASVRDQAALAKLPDAEREEWQRLWADVATLLAADPVELARAYVARRDWAKAADTYERTLEHSPTDDGHIWFEYAAVRLLAGDRPGYAKACAHMVERCGKASNLRAYHVARACTLAPDAVEDLSLPGRLAEKEPKASPEPFWWLTEQGALHDRAGRYQQAVTFFEKSLKTKPKPGGEMLNWLWLALANQRLEKTDEARRWLGKATAWLDQYDAMPSRADAELGLHLHDWLEAHILRREAEALIDSESKPK